MEKWREIYTEADIKLIQQIELKNLEVLNNVCDKLGITFFAYGGTLIGCIRHKGFIPWDDDLDVGMSREDYKKFVKEASAILPNEYYLQNPYTDSKTPYPYTKLRLKGTKYIEYSHHKLNIEKGIYIDIYPIDNLPDSDDEYYKQYKKFHSLAVLYSWRQCPYVEQQENTLKNILKRTIKLCLSTILKLVPQSVLIKKMDDISMRYNNEPTTRKGNFYFPKPVNIFQRLYPLKKVSFEGYSMNIPDCWHSHLTYRYGDYMQLPPENKRIGHKPYLLDFGIYRESDCINNVVVNKWV